MESSNGSTSYRQTTRMANVKRIPTTAATSATGAANETVRLDKESALPRDISIEVPLLSKSKTCSFSTNYDDDLAQHSSFDEKKQQVI